MVSEHQCNPGAKFNESNVPDGDLRPIFELAS